MPGADASRRPADEDATRVILMPGANTNRAPADDATRVILTPPPHSAPERIAGGEGAVRRTAPQDLKGEPDDERLSPAWRWALIAAAAIVVLIVLFALLRHARPPVNAAHQPVGVSSDGVRQRAEAPRSGTARA
jgi:hypothetical protein